MSLPKFSEGELKAIRYLREKTSALLTPYYDTDYNLLRWAQGYGFNLEEAIHHLERHLKFRKFYDLDNADKLKDDKLLKQYFPLGLVGKTGKNNHLLVVECAGRIDLHGILRAVQLDAFLAQRLKFQELMLREINKLEKENNCQSSTIYILDLEGLKLYPSLLSIVAGPYHVLWSLVYTNYPEWIDSFLIVNAPTFMTIIWKTFGPLLPERTRNKVQIFSAGHDIKSELMKHCDLKYVPKHWGGELIDANGDPMCRDRLVIPTAMIPRNHYWKPDANSPSHTDLHSIVLGVGKSKDITIKVHTFNEKIFLSLNRFSERSYSMAIFYNKFEEDNENIIFDKKNEWLPIFEYPVMPTVDLCNYLAPGPGIYTFRFGNEQAWFRSLTIYYRIRFLDERGQPVKTEQLS